MFSLFYICSHKGLTFLTIYYCNIMTNILVTGGAGFIPSSLTDELVKNAEYNVVTVDNFLTGNPLKISKSNLNNFKFIEADCNNFDQMKAIFDTHNFDYVFH